MLNLKELKFFQDLSEDDASNITGGHDWRVEVCSEFAAETGWLLCPVNVLEAAYEGLHISPYSSFYGPWLWGELSQD